MLDQRGPQPYIVLISSRVQRIREIASGSGRREWFALLMIKLNHFFDDLTEFLENLLFVVTVTTTQHKNR